MAAKRRQDVVTAALMIQAAKRGYCYIVKKCCKMRICYLLANIGADTAVKSTYILANI